MDACDVLIIGGGPAGSTCATRLREAGLDVVVLDRATFPRDKICAGWITPAVLEECRIDPADYAQGRVFQPITGFRTCRLGLPQIRTDYRQPISYGIRRCEFDHYLLARSGARLRLGEALTDLRFENDLWIANEAISAPLLIGAGGHFCPVARRVTESLPHQQEAVVVAQEIEFEMTPEQAAVCAAEGEIPELFFCEDFKGYAWVFRKGNFLNIGLGREGERNLSTHVDAFCKTLLDLGRVPPGIPERFHGHAYKLYRQAPRKLIADRVLLIGDSAGLAYPESGEGIRPAIESGLLAARVIQESKGEYSRQNLDRLQARLVDRFGSPTRRGLTARLPSGVTRWLGSQLMRTRWFTRRVVLERWFLHLHIPALKA